MLFIFDFDLTLVNSSAGIYDAFKAGFAALGKKTPSDSEIYGTIGMPIESAFVRLGGNMSEFARFFKAFKARSDSTMAALTSAYPDTLDVLKRIKSEPENSVGVFSAKDGDTIERIIDSLGFGGFVDAVVGYEDITRKKPDGEGLELMLEKFGVGRGNAVYIGDSLIDYQTSLSARVPFVAVLTGVTSREDFEKAGCTRIADNLTEAARLAFSGLK